MRVLGISKLFGVAVVATTVVALSASDALARSRGSSGSYASSGSYGSYGSYGSSGSYSVSYGSSGSSGSYSSYGSSGSHGGMMSRWHARKAAKASHGSYGSYGSYGSSGSSGGYSVSYSHSYGSYGSHGSSGSSGGYHHGGVIYDAAPAEMAAPTDQPAPPETPQPAAPGTEQPALDPNATPPETPSASASEAAIWVSLPADAKVFVNDLATTSTGAERHYVSRGLQGGRTYAYKLRVEFERDGKPVIEDRVVRLQAGNAVTLAFGGIESAEQQAAAKTELKLHVPAEAKVTLAGAATQQTGDLRTYATSNLTAGQKWDGYVVRVELEKDGKTLVEERTLSIEGGQNYEFTFEMKGDAPQVASLN